MTEQLPERLIRAKGILWFSGPRYDLKSDNWSDSPCNQLVFIGRHLDTDKICQQLNECLVSSMVV